MLNSSRRKFLSTAAAASAVAAMPIAARAAAPAAANPVQGLYRRKIGDIEVTALSDGYLDVSNDYWHDISKPEVEKLIDDAFLPRSPSIRIGITSYLLKLGDRLALVDSGSGEAFGPTAGRFAESLAAAGVKPEAVDMIMVTHMHPDHIAALIKNDGSAAFPNAALHVSETELSYWTSAEAKSKAPDFAKPWFDLAAAVNKAYGQNVVPFSGEKEVVKGVSAVSLPGHTPGQTGFRISSGTEDLLIWADACGVAAVQFAQPEAGLVFDVDGTQGAQTRKRLLDMTSTDRILAAGAHLPFPSFGHVVREGSAYRWVPEEWQYGA